MNVTPQVWRSDDDDDVHVMDQDYSITNRNVHGCI